jgi:hypothetical protein
MGFARKLVLSSMSAIFLISCGGGSDASTTTTSAVTTQASSTTTPSTDGTAGVPQPAEPITDLIPAIEGVTKKDDCAEVVELLNPVDLPDPEGGANATNCQAIGGVFGTLDGYTVSDTAEFGTAAVIDGTAPGVKFGTQTAALDQTGSFKLLGGVTKGPQLGTEPKPGVDFEAPAAAFLQAVRDDDCKSAFPTISSISRLASDNLKQFCNAFEGYYGPDGLGARLQADPAADLVDLGGTRNLHFYGLATEPAGYRTIVVGTTQHGVPRISDIVPVER